MLQFNRKMSELSKVEPGALIHTTIEDSLCLAFVLKKEGPGGVPLMVLDVANGTQQTLPRYTVIEARFSQPSCELAGTTRILSAESTGQFIRWQTAPAGFSLLATDSGPCLCATQPYVAGRTLLVNLITGEIDPSAGATCFSISKWTWQRIDNDGGVLWERTFGQ